MTIFERICIGTANWGSPYGHRNVLCPPEEQRRIIDYCVEHGINTVHTKDAYGADLSWLPASFRVIHGDVAQECWSVYTLDDLCVRDGGNHKDVGPTFPLGRWERISVPYSIIDRRWEEWIVEHSHNVAIEIHVRSIFCQGKVFSGNEPPFEAVREMAHALNMTTAHFCLNFVLLNPHVDKIVVGVDSLCQLQGMLKPFETMDGLRCDDPNVIDPRKWK